MWRCWYVDTTAGQAEAALCIDNKRGPSVLESRICRRGHLRHSGRLRCDQYFVEDEHWNEAAGRYAAFLKEHQKDKVVLLELGVGFNTPTIIRFPFEKMVRENDRWTLVRLNLREAVVPESFHKRAVGINEDICRCMEDIRKEAEKDVVR